MSKLGKEGYKRHFEILLNEEKAKIRNSGRLLQLKKRKNVN